MNLAEHMDRPDTPKPGSTATDARLVSQRKAAVFIGLNTVVDAVAVLVLTVVVSLTGSLWWLAAGVAAGVTAHNAAAGLFMRNNRLDREGWRVVYRRCGERDGLLLALSLDPPIR